MNIAVIADDLTGANDTGVQMARRGLSTSVMLELKNGNWEQEAIVFDADSRALPSEEAYEKVKTACEFLVQGSVSASPVIYKKFDSTLRGNIGIELDAVYDACKTDLMVIAPSFPSAGRVLKNGVLLVNGTPLHETEMAADPKHPAKQSSFMAILEQQSRHAAALVTLDQLHGERTALEQLIADYRSSGIAFLVFDAMSEADLSLIVSLFTNKPDQARDVIWAGSAGLASALTTRLILQSSRYELMREASSGGGARHAPIIESKSLPIYPVMIVVGSVNPWSRRQLNELMKQSNVHAVAVPSEQLLFPGHNTDEIDRIRQQAIEVIARQDMHVALYTSGNPAEVQQVLHLGRIHGMTEAQVGERISSELGRLAASIIEACDIKNMVLTGGDTAKKVCQQLSEKELQLIDEVESGVPLGKTTSKSGRFIITKAGAFGSDQVLVRSVNRLQEGVII